MEEEKLRAAQARAEEASRTKSRFLRTMSHEIRTPMNGILGVADLLLQLDLSPRAQAYAATIVASAEGLQNTLDDVLDFSRIEGGKLLLTEDDFSLRQTVRGVVMLLLPLAANKGIELRHSVAAAVPDRLHGDAGTPASGVGKPRRQCRQVHRRGVRRPAGRAQPWRGRRDGDGDRIDAVALRRPRHGHRHRSGEPVGAIRALRTGQRPVDTAFQRLGSGSCDQSASGRHDGRDARCRESSGGGLDLHL